VERLLLDTVSSIVRKMPDEIGKNDSASTPVVELRG
jgi:hypothetical protein